MDESEVPDVAGYRIPTDATIITKSFTDSYHNNAPATVYSLITPEGKALYILDPEGNPYSLTPEALNANAGYRADTKEKSEHALVSDYYGAQF